MEYRGNLKLSVSDDFVIAPVVITHKELDVDADITIKLEYLGNEYSGKGSSLEWADAFAELQKALPDGVKIQCCMTCRYGTLCPYGNIPDYILRTQTAKINSKNDVIDWLENIDTKSIKKSAFDYCKKFEFSNENHYTYNDFYHCLKN